LYYSTSSRSIRDRGIFIKSKDGGITFIYLLISIVFTIAFKNFLGLIFALIALTFSVKNIKTLKYKNFLVYITLFGSILICLLYLITFVINVDFTSKTLEKAKLNTYKAYEMDLKRYAEKYIKENQEIYNDDTFILTTDTIIKNTDIYEIETCIGYVIVSENKQEYTSFIKCDEYQTNGFDEKNIH